MSLKDYFNKNKTQTISFKKASQKSIADFSEIESENYVKELNKKNEYSLLDIDYSDPSKFAKFGLARKYYEGIEIGRAHV